MKNRKKVWEIEQDLVNEQQKLNTRLKEIEKERELNELLNESNKNKTDGLKNDLALKKSGLEWMYQDAKLSDEKEDYLLGKKKLDSSILNQRAATAVVVPAAGTATGAASTRGLPKKNSKVLKDDPMSRFKITKQKRRTPDTSKPRTTLQRGKSQSKPALDLDY